MRMLTAECEARAAGKGVGALRCPDLPAWPEVQVVPAIHAHFGNAYSTWQTAATLLHSPHDAVAARYFGSVKVWLRDKPTLVALVRAYSRACAHAMFPVCLRTRACLLVCMRAHAMFLSVEPNESPACRHAADRCTACRSCCD